MSYSFDNISDTAFWVTAFRAIESERPDAAFHDPLARKLAGERGMKMVDITPKAWMLQLNVTARTTAIDRLVGIAVAQGIDAVVNLGAGLDARPYRLQLPKTLKWIEVDFPDLISYKNEALKDEQPVCKLRRIGADLSDDATRQNLFKEFGSEAQKALVITEGVVCYLENSAASQLSRDIFAVPSFQYWVQEYLNGGFKNRRRSKIRETLMKNTPLVFDAIDPITFFKNDGWEVSQNIHVLDEADRIGRKFSLIFPFNLLVILFPKKLREAINNKFGIVMFGKPG